MRSHYFSIFFVLISALIYGQAPQNEPNNRVALVIGNSSYLSGPLKNTINDARAMAMALESAGFEVLLKEDVRNQNDMKKVVREFGMRLKTDGTALFYYSGHGMQVEGFNYLIPTQAVMNISQEIEYEALDVGFVLAYMESAKSDVNIVILDACRNNPFARSFRDTQQGLSGMVAPAGTLIAYSTSPGSVASDGEESFGLYTSALLEQMQKAGLKVEDVFKNTRAEVLDRSKGQQTPWESSSLVGDFYFHLVPGDSQVHQSPQQKDLRETPVPQQIIPYNALKTSGLKIKFKWKADPDGSYVIKVQDKDISAEVVHDLRGEHLYVYHEATNRVLILKSFARRLDGIWHTGTFYE